MRGHARIADERAHLGTGEHDAQIGRIDRCRFHSDHDVVGPSLWQVGSD
jgi:hypothetical protein